MTCFLNELPAGTSPPRTGDGGDGSSSPSKKMVAAATADASPVDVRVASLHGGGPLPAGWTPAPSVSSPLRRGRTATVPNSSAATPIEGAAAARRPSAWSDGSGACVATFVALVGSFWMLSDSSVLDVLTV